MKTRIWLSCSSTQGADIHACDRYGITLLHRVCSNGLPEYARKLIDMGADVNSCTPWGKTPLNLARADNHEAVVKLLLEHGATE